MDQNLTHFKEGIELAQGLELTLDFFGAKSYFDHIFLTFKLVYIFNFKNISLVKTANLIHIVIKFICFIYNHWQRQVYF